MNLIKFSCLISVLCTLTFANVSAQNKNVEEQEPMFPGGIPAFSKYISKTLKYPDVARLVGLTGKVVVTFVVEKDGSISGVTPVRCLGAGCESEAVKVVSMSPNWSPGMLNGQYVRVQYSVPINFNLTGLKTQTELRTLRKSDYEFVFYIKGTPYSLDEAETLLGKSFDPSNVLTVEPYDDPKYSVANKKGTYLIVMKN